MLILGVGVTHSGFVGVGVGVGVAHKSVGEIVGTLVLCVFRKMLVFVMVMVGSLYIHNYYYHNHHSILL